ncbi:MAG: hypothetical protein M0001_16820 [Treponema sp.]|nr:hypothetical protein [Treponema sp.]
MKATTAIAPVVIALLVAVQGISAQTDTKTVDLSKGSSLIVAYCSPCHDWASDYKSIMDSGVVVPGDSASSQAWVMISSGRMPAQGPAPTSKEKKLIKEWIDAGAVAPKT